MAGDFATEVMPNLSLQALVLVQKVCGLLLALCSVVALLSSTLYRINYKV